jgi:HEAT repeat protein
MPKLTCVLIALAAVQQAPVSGQVPGGRRDLQQRSRKLLEGVLNEGSDGAFWATAALSMRDSATAKEMIVEHLSRAPSDALALMRRIDPQLANDLIGELEQHLNSDTSSTAIFYATAIARAPADRAVAALSQCANLREDPLAGVCLGLLEDMGERGVPVLLGLAASGRSAARLVAVHILGDQGDRRFLQTFERNLSSGEPAVRFQAALALSKLGNARGAGILREAVQSGSGVESGRARDRSGCSRGRGVSG